MFFLRTSSSIQHMKSRVTIWLKPFDGMMMKNIWLAKRSMKKKTAAAAATELGSWFWIHQTKITSLPTIEEEQLLELKIRIVRAWNFHFFQEKRELYTAEWVSNLFAKCEYIHLYNYSGVYMFWTRDGKRRESMKIGTQSVFVLFWLGTGLRILGKSPKLAKNTLTTKKWCVCTWMKRMCVERTQTHGYGCYWGRSCKSTHTEALCRYPYSISHVCIAHKTSAVAAADILRSTQNNRRCGVYQTVRH